MSSTRSSHNRHRRREFFRSKAWLVIRLTALALIAAAALTLAILAFTTARS